MSKKVISNGCIIDEYCKYPNGTIVNGQFGPYVCTLNQTDVKTNKNKFYIMQLIKDGNKYIHFIRYGRIGEQGKPSHDEYTDQLSGIKAFEKQFKSKTGNTWGGKFVGKKGKYFMTEITIDEIKDIKTPISKSIDSKLDKRVQNLLTLISDVNIMQNALIDLEIDTKKMPLGKISKKQIDSAQDILNQISKINLDTNTSDDLDEIDNLTSQFYTLIPYACGRCKPPLINTKEKIGKYTEMLDDLRNMVVAVKLNELATTDTDKNKLDTIYDSLHTKITPLDKNSKMWQYIENYISVTHAPTHNFKVELLDIYEIEREGERKDFEKYCKNIDNHHLLFHGSRITNFCSILQKGLILNPESLGVYITGKMFGYGLYFASASSKSINYCNTETSNNIGAMLLCDVALGNQSKRTSADYYISKKSLDKEKCNSTWGMGKSTPRKFMEVDGVNIPCGKLINSKIKSDLLYDEYIVYDTKQVNQKYLVLFKKI